MQIELLDRQPLRTNLELAVAMADYIEHFYNPAGLFDPGSGGK